MTCYHPIPAFLTSDGGVVFVDSLRRNDVIRSLDLPCGQCIGCRLRRARDWSVRVMHEASLYERNCFVTLTYAPEHLPSDGSLRYVDFQLFMKRLRKHFFPQRIRFFMCGEYGPLNLRPHYHVCLFNCSFDDMFPNGKSGAGAVFFDSPLLSDLWLLGKVSVQELNSSTAAYCARYVVDKVTGDGAEAHYGGRTPEYCRCSLKPGIGARWFERFGQVDVYRHDFVVQDGDKLSPPRYYDRLQRRKRLQSMDDIEYARELRAKAVLADNTDERLRVREVVHRARVRNQKREL